MLDNGLTVLLDVHRQEPRVAWRLAVRAGAADDRPGESGTAHLLEHMLANKGTLRLGVLDAETEAAHRKRIRALSNRVSREKDPEQRRALGRALDQEELLASRLIVPNELKQAAGRLGARSFNASTSLDRTQYKVDLPANRLPHWALLDADRLADSVVRAFATELSTVCEEKRRSLDDPGRTLSAALATALWPGHPYAIPVLGHIEELERASVSQLERFLQDWYRPPNACLALSGDLDPDETLVLLERCFGGLEPGGPLPGHPAPPAPLQGEHRVEVVHQDDDELHIAWRTVPRTHPDFEALLLIDHLLSNRSTGLIDLHLNHPQKVRRAGSYRGNLRLGGYTAVWARPREGQSLPEVEGLLLEMVEKLCRGDFDPAILTAIQRNLAVGEQRGLESAGARVEWLLRSFVFEQPWPDAGRWLERVQAITAEDVVRAARQYLGPDRVIAVRRRGDPQVPLVSAPETSPRPKPGGQNSAFFAEVLSLPVEPLQPQRLQPGLDYQLSEEPWGRLYRNPNPCNALFQLRLRWEIGTDRRRGLGTAFGLWGRSGTATLDRSALERRLYEMAAGLSWSVDRRRMELQLQGPPDALEPVMRLLTERLSSPRVPEDERERHADDLLARRQEQKKSRDTRISALHQLALRGDDSGFLRPSLSDEEVRAIARDPDLGRWSAPLRGMRLVAFYTGRHDEEQVRAAMQLLVEPAEAPPPVEPLHYLQPAEDRVLLLQQPGAQASVAVLQPVPPETTEDAALRLLLNEYLGGSAGVFFQEVREARGWAYSVQGQLSSGGRQADDALRWASAATATERAAETAALLLQLLREPPADPQRFERARAAAIEKLRAHRVGFRGMGPTLEGWRLRGYTEDPRPARLRAFEAATLEAMLAHLARQAQAPISIAVLGDLSAMNVGGFGSIGPVDVLEDGDVFAW